MCEIAFSTLLKLNFLQPNILTNTHHKIVKNKIKIEIEKNIKSPNLLSNVKKYIY